MGSMCAPLGEETFRACTLFKRNWEQGNCNLEDAQQALFVTQTNGLAALQEPHPPRTAGGAHCLVAKNGFCAVAQGLPNTWLFANIVL